MKDAVFSEKMNHPAYTIEQSIQETTSALAMERMNLTDEDLQMLTRYSEGKISGDELRFVRIRMPKGHCREMPEIAEKYHIRRDISEKNSGSSCRHQAYHLV
ncbi:MAG: hypothetical protein J6A79_08805 [Clostridia bacterium]|nr:hypothetical protein [Clostridia bacterium]